MALWLGLHLPRLALEALGLEDDAPAAVTDRIGPREVVVGVSQGVRGVWPGMAATQARSLEPGLRLHPRRPERERDALRRLAAWALQFTSHVHLPGAPPEPGAGRLLLEIGGSRRLFGGRDALIRRIASGLGQLGYAVQTGHAAAPRAALLLARAGDGGSLAGQPTGLLDLPGQTLAALEASGLRRIGQVLALPRAALGRRFGAECLDYLARLAGEKDEPLEPFQPPRSYAARLELAAEAERVEALRFVLKRLVGELAGSLRGADAAVQQLAVRLEHAGQPPTVLRWSLSLPTRDAARIQGLIEARLERTPLPAPVRALRLATGRFTTHTARQSDLFDARGHDDEAAGALLDRLRARLGDDAVSYLATAADHRPEHASRAVREPTPTGEVAAGPRPAWLLPAPEPLRRPPRVLTGPERIEGGWWSQDIGRDYYVAQDDDGRRLWVFRERRPPHRWYLHGVFG